MESDAGDFSRLTPVMFSQSDIERAKLSALKEDGTLTRDAEALARKGVSWTSDESIEMFNKEQRKRLIEALANDLRDEMVRCIREGSSMQYYSFMERFLTLNPMYYDKSKMWWVWDSDGFLWRLVDETDVINLVKITLRVPFDKTVKSQSKNTILECLRQISRIRKPKDFPKHWIQFKDKIYDIESKKILPSTSEYFCANPIPWKLGDGHETLKINKLFEEWVGKDHVEELFEILAYCCVTDYFIHRIFYLIGGGRNGKSSFLDLILIFIGAENCCSTDLELLLENRFEIFKLYKKLVCTMGETNFGILTQSSRIKRLSGNDTVGFEAKNHMPFDGKSYAKLIIASNNLPTSEDTSDGFYSRAHIIDFPNRFEEIKGLLDQIPAMEYENLARRIIDVYLPRLFDTCQISNGGTIEDRKEKYIATSNPFKRFVHECCDVSDDPDTFHIRTSELYNAYGRWLIADKKRKISRKEFGEVLAMDGFETFYGKRLVKKTNGLESENNRWVLGVRLDFERYDKIMSHKKPAIMAKSEKNTVKSENGSSPVTPVTKVTTFYTGQNEGGGGGISIYEKGIYGEKNKRVEEVVTFVTPVTKPPTLHQIKKQLAQWIKERPLDNAEFIDSMIDEMHIRKLMENGWLYQPRKGTYLIIGVG